MATLMYHRDTCRVCQGHDLQLALKMQPTPIEDAYLPKERMYESRETYPLDLYLCPKCGLSQLSDVVDPEAIYGNYLYETTTSPGLVEHFRTYADDVMKQVSLSPGSFIAEIGSNDGTLLRFLQDRGMRVLGIDPARDITERATESGVETLPRFFTRELAKEIRNERGPAAVVIANNVIANIDDLDDLMAGVCELLAPDGVFIFETGYLVDMVQNRVFDNIFHEHFSYYSVKSLKFLFNLHGLELVSVDRTPMKGGSVRGIVQFSGGVRAQMPSVDQLIDLEGTLKINRLGAFESLASHINLEKGKLLVLLNDLKRQGKRIAGYCASHTVTTFIYYFGIGQMVDFLVDDNAIKQNTFSPGHHIPVFSPQKIYEEQPDYLLILAWRFYKPIMNNHRKYLERGGRFVIPLPEMKIIDSETQTEN